MSPWTPPGVFLLGLLLYWILVEASPCAARWVRPGLLVVAALCALALAAFLLLRLLLRRAFRAFALEYRALELFEELGQRRDAQTSDPERARLRRELDALLEQKRPVETSSALAELEEQADRLLGSGGAWVLAATFLKALAIVFVVRGLVVEPYRIPSGSMLPTLEVGDQILINKFLFGLRIPWLNRVPFVLVRAPERGDVIVFNNPVEPDKDFIKRVAGVPGDRVQLVNKVVFVNGEPQGVETLDAEHAYWDRPHEDGPWVERTGTLVAESLGASWHLGLRNPGAPRGETEVFVVPEGSLFVLGDNRDASGDSRFGLGRPELGAQYVPLGRVKGRASMVLSSVSHGGFGAQWTGGTGLRLDRFFQPVHACPRDP